MSILISFSRTSVIFFGGYRIEISGELGLELAINILSGANGSGKTTVAKCIAYALGHPYAPISSIENSSVQFQPAISSASVGFVYENPADNFHGGPVYDNLQVALANPRVDHDELQGRISEMLVDDLDLDPWLLIRRTNILSTGELQLVALVLQAILNPKFLFLDEALSHLSRNNLRRAMLFIEKHFRNTYLCLICHPDQIVGYLRKEVFRYSVEKRAQTILITNPVEWDNEPAIVDADSANFLDYATLSEALKQTDNFNSLSTHSVFFFPQMVRAFQFQKRR